MMDYGLRYCFLYRAKMRGRFLYEVVIEEKGYEGDVEILKPCGDVLTIRQGVQDDSPFVPIKGSEATIEILCTDDMRYLSLFTVDARRFRVSVYEYRPDTAGKEVPILIWRGFLDANSYTEKFARPPYKVSLKALDGLMALAGYPFLNEAGDRYKGLMSARSLIDLCLIQLSLDMPLCEWIGVRRLSGSTETLDDIHYDCADIYRSNDNATWGDVLRLCLPFGAQIFQAYGKIHIRRTSSLILNFRPEGYAKTHTSVGIGRRPYVPFWEHGCGISASADLKILPPLRNTEIEVNGKTSQNLAISMGFYDDRQWDIHLGTGRFFDDCLQLQIVDNEASATFNITKFKFNRTFEATKEGGVSIKFDVINLNSRERKVRAALFLRWFDTSISSHKIEAWYPNERSWLPVDDLSSDRSMYIERTIAASDQDNTVVGHRADPSKYSSDSLSITTTGIPHAGQLWVGIKAGSVHGIGNYDWANLQIRNAEIVLPGDYALIVPTKVVDTINRDYNETLKIELPVSDGAYVPNVGFYLNNLIRDASGNAWLYARAPYGGDCSFGVALADAGLLRAKVAYELAGEIRCESPVDMNTLFFDRKHTGRLYYVNYLERNISRDLYKAQLYELMDANSHPQWTGTYKSIIDRNDFDVKELFSVNGTLFFSEKYQLWRMDEGGVPQKVLTTRSDLYVYQGAGSIVVAIDGDETWIAAYDASGFQTAKIANPSERLAVLPSDAMTRDATTGLWYASHYESGTLTVTIFKDNACIIDTRTFECEDVRKTLFAPNSIIVVTDKTSYIHNFSIHSDGELSGVEYWEEECRIEAITRLGLIFESRRGTHFNSRVGMGLWISEGITVPAADITTLGDRFAAAYGGSDIIYIYDYYNGILSEVPAPEGRVISHLKIIGSMLYALADNEILQYYILDDTVLGEGNYHSYILEPIIAVASIGAAGGVTEISALLKVIDETGTLISSEVVTPTVTGYGEGFKIDGNKVFAENRETIAGPERDVILTLSHPFVRNGIKQTVAAQATVRQVANRIERMTVASPEIVSGELPISAAGGVVRMAFPLSGTFTSGSTDRLDLYPDTITGSPLATWLRVRTINVDNKGVGLEISASGLGTTECPEKSTTINMRLSKRDQYGVQYRMDFAVEVSQSANRLESYGAPTLVASTISVGDVPASGGTAGALRFSGAQAAVYSSGDSLPVAFTESTSGIVVSHLTTVSGSNLGTTVKARTKLGDQRFTVKLRDKISAEYSAAVYQRANLVTRIVADSSFRYAAIGAGDVSAKPTTLGSGLLIFASGAETTVSNTTQAPAGTDLGVSSAYKLLEVKNGFTAVSAAGVLTATARGTTVGAARTSGPVQRLLTWTLKHTISEGGTVVSTGTPATATCTQAENRIEAYGMPTLVASTISVGDVPASGGTAGALRFSGAQAAVYSSGDSLPVAFTESTAGIVVSHLTTVSGSNLGTTIKARTLLGNLRFTVRFHDQSSEEHSAAVYQQANTLDGLSHLSSALVSGTNPLPASGGSSVTSHKLRASYTSGATAAVYPSAVVIDRQDAMPDGYTVSSIAVSGKGRSVQLSAPDLGTAVTAARYYVYDVTFRYGSRSVSRTGLQLRQAANTIVSGTKERWEVEGAATLTVPRVPAAGGSVSAQLVVAFDYTSGASETARISEYTGLPVPAGAFTWSTRSGKLVLSAPSRGLVMGNEFSVTKTITYRYKGLEFSDTTAYKQQGNYIARLLPSIPSFGYDVISAADTIARSHGNIAVTLVFDSGERVDRSGPFSNEAGTLSAARSFTLEEMKNGFTAVDGATGALTATARGTIVGAARTSGPVRLTAQFTFVHSDTFAAGGTVTGTVSAAATCTQLENLVTRIVADSSFRYAAIGAGDVSAKPTTLGSGLLIFASGAETTVSNTTQAPAGTKLGVSSAYKLLEVKNGFTAVSVTGVLTATARGTTVGAARTSGPVQRLLTWTLRHDSALFPEGGRNMIGGSRSSNGWSVYDRFVEGVFERDNATTSEKYIYAPEVTLVAGQTYTLSFEYRTTANVAGVDAYVYRKSDVAVQLEKKLGPASEWTRVQATFTAGISASCAVRFDNNGTSDGAASTLFIRHAQLERGAQASPYIPSVHDAVPSSTTPATATCTQAENRIESYGKPTLVTSTISVGDVPASGGTTGIIRFSGAQAAVYSSGDSLPVAFSESTTGVSTTISIETPVAGSNLGTTIRARTLLGTLRFQVTAHGQTSDDYSAAVYQQANELEAVQYTGSVGIISGPSNPRSYPAAGGTSEIYLKLSAVYTSGSSKIVNPSSANPRPAVRWITAQRFEHSTYGDCVRLVVVANTAASRTGSVAVTLAYEEGGKSVSDVVNLTVVQVAGN